MSAKLYLIRHGIAAEALPGESDEERALTAAGERKTRKVAKHLQKLNIHFDLILTSPLVRARQTAEILQAVGLAAKIEEFQDLAPGGNLENWLSWLKKWRQNGGNSLAIVGHQPDLTNWAEILVWGEARERLILKKAGIIGLQLPETATETPVSNCLMFWLAPPKLLLA